MIATTCNTSRLCDRLHAVRDQRGGTDPCIGYAIAWNVPTRPQLGRSWIFKNDSITTPHGCAVQMDHKQITMLAHSHDGRVVIQSDDFGLLVGFVPENFGDLQQNVGYIRHHAPGMSLGLMAGRRIGSTHGGIVLISSAQVSEVSITRRPRQPATYVKVAGHNCPPESERAEYEAEERRLATMQQQFTDRMPLASRVRNWKTINRLARLRAEARLAFV